MQWRIPIDYGEHIRISAVVFGVLYWQVCVTFAVTPPIFTMARVVGTGPVAVTTVLTCTAMVWPLVIEPEVPDGTPLMMSVAPGLEPIAVTDTLVGAVMPVMDTGAVVYLIVAVLQPVALKKMIGVARFAKENAFGVVSQVVAVKVPITPPMFKVTAALPLPLVIPDDVVRNATVCRLVIKPGAAVKPPPLIE